MKVIVKMAVLATLMVMLFCLLLTNYQKDSFEKVVIVEKYYANSNRVAYGVSTDGSIEVSGLGNGSVCILEFSNGKIFEIDCDKYLRYSIGEEVKITYDKNKLLDIRRK